MRTLAVAVSTIAFAATALTAAAPAATAGTSLAATVRPSPSDPLDSFEPATDHRRPALDRTSLLVKFTAATAVRVRDAGADPSRALARRARAVIDKPTKPVVGRWVVVDAGDDNEQVRRELLADPSVATVTYDPWRRAHASDPLFPRHQEYLRRTMDFPQAWERATGAGVTVAVIDSGVDRSHKDLGKVLRGRDFVDGDRRVTDPNGHGTFVSGIVAAIRGNHRGIAGGSRATILPIRALDARGFGRDSTIARAVRWAVSHRADVINLSLGGARSSRILRDALGFAERNDVLVVASSGNDGGTKKSYPAAIPTAVAVGATDDKDRLAWFSQHGPWVDLAAPGWQIASTIPGDRYASGSGTSFSAPLVSAAAALLIGRHQRWPIERVRDVLMRGAADTGPVGPDAFAGFGTVDVDGILGGGLSWHGQASYGGGATTPATARDLTRRETNRLAPEGGELWYVYERSQAAQVLISASSRNDALGVQRLDLVLEIYDADLHLIRRIDRHRGGRLEETPVKLTDRVYVRVTNRGPTRSPAGIDVRATYIGTANQATMGSGPRPVITAATPRPNELHQDPTLTLEIEMGRPLAPNSVNAKHVRVIDGSTGQVVPRSVSYNATTRVVTIDPQQPLSGQRDYAVVLQGLRGLAGAQLPETRYGFRTQ